MAATTPYRNERLAVAGMALIVFTVSVMLHEGLGHGGACLALGGKPVTWGAFYFDCMAPNLVAERLVTAAGSTVNLVVALVALGLLQVSRSTGARLFWWLLFAVNGFQWAGYYAFSGLAGIGDWAGDGVLKGVTGPGFWVARGIEAVAGAGLYYGCALLAGRRLAAITGGSPERRKLAYCLSNTAYFIGGGLALLVGLLNPVGIVIVLISALASTFGGASGLTWLTRRMPQNQDEPPLEVLKPAPWLAAGVVVALAFAAALGRSITFR